MPKTPERIVVIGGGLAAAKTVEALRSEGYEGKLDLVTDEADLPYERPPLSKDYLQGKADFDKLVLATGAVPRKLDLPGADALKYLRTHHDSDVLKQAFGPDQRVVVIGA